MLGAGAIGVTPAAMRRPGSTLLTGTAGRTGTGSGGTLLAPTTGGRPGGGTGGGSTGQKPIMQR